jgi:hypothetical protein
MADIRGNCGLANQQDEFHYDPARRAHSALMDRSQPENTSMPLTPNA